MIKRRKIKPSAVHFRFILNYDKVIQGNREVLVYPLFESFRILRNIKERKQERIFDIDRFELTYFPDLMAFYKLDLRKNKKPGFILTDATDAPRTIHSVNFGETNHGSWVYFKYIFHWKESRPYISAYLQRKASRSKIVEYKSVIDFPLELIFPEALISKIFRTRKKLLNQSGLNQVEKIYGPYNNPLNKDTEWEMIQIKFFNKFMTVVHEYEE
jgi:hypothetical protein